MYKLGTTLCSAAVNALNMLYEPDTDAKMSRTRAGPLVRGLLSTRTAVLFATVKGTNPIQGFGGTKLHSTSKRKDAPLQLTRSNGKTRSSPMNPSRRHRDPPSQKWADTSTASRL
jgi:hypothetical protein